MTAPKGYSTAQIALHWGVALLILAQFVFSDAMSAAWRVFERGGTPDVTLMVRAHVIGGVAIMLFVLWRLVLRLRRGVPDAPAGSPLMMAVGEWTHRLLYALMILLPISGSLAWFGGYLPAGEGHQLLKVALLVLVALHVAAALFHQFFVKDHLLARMMRAGN